MVFFDIDEQKIYALGELEDYDIENKNNLTQISELLATPVEWIIEKGFRIQDANIGLFLNLENDSVFIEFIDSPRHLYDTPVGFKWMNDNVLVSHELDNENWAFRLEEICELMFSLVDWIQELGEPSGMMA